MSASKISRFYHPRQIGELKKKLGVTLDETSGLLNESQVSKMPGLSYIFGYRKQGLIKPMGRALTGGPPSYFYHPRQIKELKAKLKALKRKA